MTATPKQKLVSLYRILATEGPQSPKVVEVLDLDLLTFLDVHAGINSDIHRHGNLAPFFFRANHLSSQPNFLDLTIRLFDRETFSSNDLKEASEAVSDLIVHAAVRFTRCAKSILSTEEYSSYMKGVMSHQSTLLASRS